MEENLIDSSKYKISLISLDSRFAVAKGCRNGEFKINIPKKLKNVMRIRMATAEIPLVEYTFSLKNGNTTFAVKIGSNLTFTKCKPIPDGNYCIENLVCEIEESLKSVHSGFCVEFSKINGIVTISNTSAYFEIYLASYNKNIAKRSADWGIGYNLGFREFKVVAQGDDKGGFFIKSNTVYNLKPSPYYLLQLECPESVENVTHPLLDDGYLSAFAKVILKNNVYTYQFDDNSNLMRKEFTYLAPQNIPYFFLRLVDTWGETVDMMDIDWSVTLEITEVVNSKTFATISNTYSRN